MVPLCVGFLLPLPLLGFDVAFLSVAHLKSQEHGPVRLAHWPAEHRFIAVLHSFLQRSFGLLAHWRVPPAGFVVPCVGFLLPFSWAHFLPAWCLSRLPLLARLHLLATTPSVNLLGSFFMRAPKPQDSQQPTGSLPPLPRVPFFVGERVADTMPRWCSIASPSSSTAQLRTWPGIIFF